MPIEHKIILLSGFSGSGKTTALRVFEEAGYYCVDNLPAMFLPEFLKQARLHHKKVAIVVDARGRIFATDLQKILTQIQRKYKVQIVFVTCSLATVTKRYQEARMTHPLLKSSVRQGYELEMKYLDEFRQRADSVIDSSLLNVHQLRREVKSLFFNKVTSHLEIGLLSFGYKNGLPLEADMVFDVRFLPNPYFDKGLKKTSGQSKKVDGYIFRQDVAKNYYKLTRDYIQHLVKYYQQDGRAQILLAFGCTGGFHRSVAIVNRLAKDLAYQSLGHKRPNLNESVITGASFLDSTGPRASWVKKIKLVVRHRDLIL